MKKISTFNGVVVKAIQETKDTWTLYIFTGDNPKEYKAGQFVSINPNQFLILGDIIKYLEYKKQKKEQVRAYSLSSAPYEKYLAITIKPESYNPESDSFFPLLAPLLASDFLLGKEIELLGFSGAYVMPDDLTGIEEVIHFVAGSGVVPSYSILKEELHNQNNPQIKHKLIYINKTSDDIIYKNELKKLESKYPDQFEVAYFLTRDNNKRLEKNYFLGRPTMENVRELIKNPNKALFFACGPAVTKWQKKVAEENNQKPEPRFMEWVQYVIEDLKVDKKRYKKEVYG